MGPHSDPDKSLKSGHAAHINAAAPGGPRYNPDQTPAQRRHISNGIWACKDCGDQIDKDEERYKEEDLRVRKIEVEQAIDIARRSGFAEGHRVLSALAPGSEFASTFTYQRALAASHQWINGVFSQKTEAKRYFGQTLAPAATYPYPVLGRTEIVTAIADSMKANSRTLVAVLGEEGVGKSWVVAKALLEWTTRPLTVFMSAKDILPTSAYNNIIEQIVDRLILQTGEQPSKGLRDSWLQVLTAYGPDSTGDSRLIVCIDGLNENADVDWPRWISGAISDLGQISGCLLVTDRKAHFEQKIAPALSVETATMSVVGWTKSELEILLAGRKVNLGDLDPEVRASLQNPRLLGIALSLDKFPLEELTRQRLLFEYIRFSQAENRLGEDSLKFSRRLADHAQDIREKAQRQQNQDLGRYSVNDFEDSPRFALSEDLLHASTSQFYTQLPTPGHYRLSDDGLNVALGIGLIYALKEASADGKGPSEALESVLEPIEALDMTADVVFAAMQFAAADNEASPIQSALLSRFLQLQNINTEIYPAFVSAIRASIEVALDALYEIDRNKSQPSLKNWLVEALRDVREVPDAWNRIQRRVDKWLRLYTLKPDPQLSHFGQTPEESKARLDKGAREIKAQQRALTSNERDFLKGECVRDDTINPSHLGEDAFLLLAGMPLEGLATALVAWSLHHALNEWWPAPSDRFCELIQFNRADWAKTKVAIEATAKRLSEQPLSDTGRWCLAMLWRAIGTDETARRREALLDILRPNRHIRQGGRLVELMSATDPCDPASSAPEDLTRATETANKQDFSNIYRSRTGKSVELRSAEPALARWLPDLAIATERRVGEAVLAFQLPELGLAMHMLSAETAALDEQAVAKLCEIARAFNGSEHHNSNAEREEWRAAQFALLAAVPHLTAQEQFALINDLDHPGSLLVATAEMFDGVDEATFEDAYLAAHAASRDDKMLINLCFAAYSETPLISKVQDVLLEQAFAEDEQTFLAIETLARRGSIEILEKFVASGWRADDIDDNSKRAEKFYGSIILTKVAADGRLDVLDLLERGEPSSFSYAAKQLGSQIAHPLTQLLSSCVSRIANVSIPDVTPAASKHIQAEDLTAYPRTDVHLEDPPRSLKESLERRDETDEDFAARVERADTRFRNFEDNLKTLDASEVLQDLGKQAVEVAYQFDSEEVLHWAQMCIRAPAAKRRQLANIALTIGSVISEGDDKLAAELFDKYATVKPTLNLTYDLRGLAHRERSLWTGRGGPEIAALRTRRLDEAATDQALADNVDAAITGGQEWFLRQYVESNIQSPIPAIRGRALMVAGFMNEDPWIDTLFDSMSQDLGLVADALEAARYAYDRNRWSKHWVAKMSKASSAAQFWLCSKLLRKIVDFRLEFWARDLVASSPLWQRFYPTIRSDIPKRIKDWKEKRSKTLFDRTAPDERIIKFFKY